MAKSEKKAAVQPGSGKVASGKSSGAETPPGKDEAGSKNTLFIIGAVAAAILVGGLVYWKTSSNGNAGGPGPKTDPDLAALMTPGPLPEMALGSADAPNTIVEYASMTCPHCAHFQNDVFPRAQDQIYRHRQGEVHLARIPARRTGALAAFMVARCSVRSLFPDGRGAVRDAADLGGAPALKARTSCCDRAAGRLLEGELRQMPGRQGAVRQDRRDPHARGNEKFGVDSTPSFFVNGKRLSGAARAQGFRGQPIGSQPAEAADDTRRGQRFPDASRWRDADAATGQA